MIINGDLSQIDIKYLNDSGLNTAKKKLYNLKTIKFISLNKKDIVRHKIVSEILSAYEKWKFFVKEKNDFRKGKSI